MKTTKGHPFVVFCFDAHLAVLGNDIEVYLFDF